MSVEQIHERLAEMFGSADDATLWLQTPNTLFAGELPQTLIGSEHQSLLEELIERAEAGDFS